MLKKIIVFSDNHSYDGDMIKILKKEKYDFSVNCGDHLYSDKKIKSLFNYYVDGNNDFGKKEIEIFKVDNKKFIVVHGHKQWSPNYENWIFNLRKLGKKNNADVVIFGHSHIAWVDTKETPYVINPGSISLPRSHDVIGSYLMITLDDEMINFEIKTI